MKTMKLLGRGSGVGAVLALILVGLAACGSEFGGDCKDTRTCSVDDEIGGSGGNADGAGGEHQGGAGAESGPAAGAGGDNLAGAGEDPSAGAGGADDCRVANDCPVPNDPPTVVAVTPANAAVGVEPDTEIVIELSEPPAEATVNTDNIRILDGEQEVAGKVSHANSKITFVPDKPLALLATYQVVLSTALTDVQGAGLAEEFDSSFATRDGAWSLKTVVPGAIIASPQELQMSSDGDALVSWLAETQNGCAATAAWYNRGKPGLVRPFTFGKGHFCADLHSAISPSGLALIGWYEESSGSPNVVATAEFRDGKWGSATKRSERSDTSGGAAAATDEGTMHYFGAATDVQVWQTDALGAWSTAGKAIGEFAAKRGVQTAVAPNGDAVAAWLDEDASNRDRILVSRYSKQTETWSSGAVLPGSLSGVNDHNRDVPAVAFDATNQPLVVWQRDSYLVASHFDAANSTWVSHEKSDRRLTDLLREPPALVFDGSSFVIAYRPEEDVIEVVRYDRVAGSWGTPKPMQSATTKAAPRMPRMTTDAHGNLLLLWASIVESGVYSLAYQRFDASAGAWLGAKPIEDVTITHVSFDADFGRIVMGGNADGLAAVAFADLNSSSRNLRLASFY